MLRSGGSLWRLATYTLYRPFVFLSGATAMSVSPPAGLIPGRPTETLLGGVRVVKCCPLSVDLQAKVPPQRPPMTQNTFSDEPVELPDLDTQIWCSASALA